MNNVKQLIKETKRYLTKYDYDKVIELCDRILEIQPDSTFGLRFKGIALFQSGRYREGLDYYCKLYELSHDDDATYSIAYLNEKLENYDDALKYYEKSPETDLILSKRKRLLTRMKRYQQIIDEYDIKLKELNKLETTRSNIYRKLVLLEEKGVFQYRKEEYDNAFNTFKEASELYQIIKSENPNPKKPRIGWYDILGEILEKSSSPRDFFNEFLNLEKNGKHWYYRIRYNHSQFEDSLVYSDLLLELNPDNIDLLRVCALKSKNIDDDYSLDCWNKILDIEPENVEAVMEILDIYSNHFSKDKSLKLIDEKLYIDEIKLDLMERKFRLLESMTLYDEAMHTYDEYLSIAQEYDDPYNQLTIYDKIRCIEQKAIELFTDAHLDESYNAYLKAYEIFQKAKDSDSHTSWETTMDDWYDKILKQSLQKSGDDPSTFFKEFFRLNSKTLEVWIDKIRFLISWKHFGNPITYCNILLNKKPDNIRLLLTKGYVHYSTGRLQKSLLAYDRVLELDSDNDEAKNYKFNILMQWEEYMKSYKILKSMKVDYSIVNNNLERLANELLEKGKYEESLHVYETIFRETNRIGIIDKIKFLLIKTGNSEKLHESPYYMNWIDLINHKYESYACPDCGNDMIEILYGYPAPEAMARAEKGEIKLGGCIVSDDSPTHYCKHCKKYVNMGTYMIDITSDNPELSYYARGNIRWITKQLMTYPKNSIKHLEKEASKIGMDSKELMKFIEKLEEIGHIKIEKNNVQLVKLLKNGRFID